MQNLGNSDEYALDVSYPSEFLARKEGKPRSAHGQEQAAPTVRQVLRDCSAEDSIASIPSYLVNVEKKIERQYGKNCIVYTVDNSTISSFYVIPGEAKAVRSNSGSCRREDYTFSRIEPGPKVVYQQVKVYACKDGQDVDAWKEVPVLLREARAAHSLCVGDCIGGKIEYVIDQEARPLQDIHRLKVEFVGLRLLPEKQGIRSEQCADEFPECVRRGRDRALSFVQIQFFHTILNDNDPNIAKAINGENKFNRVLPQCDSESGLHSRFNPIMSFDSVPDPYTGQVLHDKKARLASYRAALISRNYVSRGTEFLWWVETCLVDGDTGEVLEGAQKNPIFTQIISIFIELPEYSRGYSYYAGPPDDPDSKEKEEDKHDADRPKAKHRNKNKMRGCSSSTVKKSWKASDSSDFVVDPPARQEKKINWRREACADMK
jgi:hypothetical protein